MQQLDVSEDGRFICFSKKITSNCFRTMFRGYDSDSGCEIAWACYDISRYTEGRWLGDLRGDEDPAGLAR